MFPRLNRRGWIAAGAFVALGSICDAPLAVAQTTDGDSAKQNADKRNRARDYEWSFDFIADGMARIRSRGRWTAGCAGALCAAVSSGRCNGAGKQAAAWDLAVVHFDESVGRARPELARRADAHACWFGNERARLAFLFFLSARWRLHQ